MMENERSGEVGERAAGAGGEGAPPAAGQANRAAPRGPREYRSDTISVFWYADRCIHSADCIRALPRVFNPRRRPWVELGAGSADAVAEAVLRCPTGALHYQRHDGGAPEPLPSDTVIEPVPGGPYYVRGPARITSGSGEVLREDTRMALCRCGRSQHSPFCDNSHRADPAGGAGPPSTTG